MEDLYHCKNSEKWLSRLCELKWYLIFNSLSSCRLAEERTKPRNRKEHMSAISTHSMNSPRFELETNLTQNLNLSTYLKSTGLETFRTYSKHIEVIHKSQHQEPKFCLPENIMLGMVCMKMWIVFKTKELESMSDETAKLLNWSIYSITTVHLYGSNSLLFPKMLIMVSHVFTVMEFGFTIWNLAKTKDIKRK